MLLRDGVLIKPSKKSKNPIEVVLHDKFEELKDKWLKSERGFVVTYPPRLISEDVRNNRMNQPSERGIRCKATIIENFGTEEDGIPHTWVYYTSQKVDAQTKEPIYMPRKISILPKSNIFHADKIEIIFWLSFISPQAGKDYIVRDEAAEARQRLNNEERKYTIYKYLLDRDNAIPFEDMKIVAKYFGLPLIDQKDPTQVAIELHSYIINKMATEGDKAYDDFIKSMKINDEVRLRALVMTAIECNAVIHHTSGVHRYWAHNKGANKTDIVAGDKICDIKDNAENDLFLYLKFTGGVDLEIIKEKVLKYSNKIVIEE